MLIERPQIRFLLAIVTEVDESHQFSAAIAIHVRRRHAVPPFDDLAVHRSPSGYAFQLHISVIESQLGVPGVFFVPLSDGQYGYGAPVIRVHIEDMDSPGGTDQTFRSFP